MEIEFEMEGLNDLINIWTAHRDTVESILPEINPVIITSIMENYANQGRPQWIERSRAYAKKMKREYPDTWPWPILKKSGDKRRLELGSASVPFHKESEGEYTLNVISTWYGYFHQYGRGVPVRKSAKLTNREYWEIEQILINGFFKRHKK